MTDKNATSSKRKEAPSHSINKNIKKNRTEQENDQEHDQLILIEIEERKMALEERAIANRKAQAEIEKLEIENQLMKKQLI